MEVKIQLFSILRSRRPNHNAQRPESVEIADGATVADLIAFLKLSKMKPFAFIERKKVQTDRVLKPGETVGLFPPIIGG
ncbi:MAG: MoaD/ThiS family protein [Proteobacteria bacterium]|nr:MoaD/ThiS family protein [Pseudomonadota bacterium]